MGTSHGDGRFPNANKRVLGVFCHVASILIIVSYMRSSGSIAWEALLLLTPPFQLTGSNKVVHRINLLVVFAIQFWYWYEVAQYSEHAALYVGGALLSILASGPI